MCMCGCMLEGATKLSDQIKSSQTKHNQTQMEAWREEQREMVNCPSDLSNLATPGQGVPSYTNHLREGEKYHSNPRWPQGQIWPHTISALPFNKLVSGAATDHKFIQKALLWPTRPKKHILFFWIAGKGYFMTAWTLCPLDKLAPVRQPVRGTSPSLRQTPT